MWARLAESNSHTPSKVGTTDVYMSEPFNLAYIIKESWPAGHKSLPDSSQMHFPMPPLGNNKDNETLDHGREIIRDLEHDPSTGSNRFTLGKQTHDSLVQTYFEVCHRAFPILDKEEFITSLENDTASSLLLQGVYLVAACHCEESVILSSGWASKHQAKLTFSRRAEEIYNTNNEPSTVTLIQALFLMSFWWGGLLDQKDTWHWLGCSIRFAQARGMHRTFVDSTKSPLNITH